MKKLMKKFLVGSLTLIVIVSNLVGCKWRESDEPIDTTKTQLYIGNYKGGIGQEWLDALEKPFEDANPGVEVRISTLKTEYEGDKLLATMPTNKEDIYFLNDINYSIYKSKGYLADITDIVTKKDAKGKSIESRMNDEIKPYYKDASGKYYATPFYYALFGTVYDVDLFDEKKLYFDDDGEYITNLDQKSAGIDNIKGTQDDGLPRTYDEFDKLLTLMNGKGITPYTWSGANAYYRMRLLTSVWADYEGKENYSLNNTFSGEYTFEGDSSPTEINNSNAYLLQKQKGKEYALTYAHNIISNKYYDDNSFDLSYTNLSAQNRFLISRLPDDNIKPIAMLGEGGWWENEARTLFNSMGTKHGEEWGYGNRNFAYMPTPKKDATKGTKSTFTVGGANSVVCISSNTDQLELAKKFLEFTHTEEAMRVFTKCTGTKRPYEYSMTEKDLSSMTPFAQNTVKLFENKNIDTVYNDLMISSMQRDNFAYFRPGWAWNSMINGEAPIDPLKGFAQNPSFTVSDYFNGLTTYYKDWDKKFSKWF